LFQPVSCHVEGEATFQVVVILRASLLPPLKSAPARALAVKERSAKRRSWMKLWQSLSSVVKLSLIRIRSLYWGRLLSKPELRSMASGIGVAMRLHRRRSPVQSRRIYGMKEKDMRLFITPQAFDITIAATAWIRRRIPKYKPLSKLSCSFI